MVRWTVAPSRNVVLIDLVNIQEDVAVAKLYFRYGAMNSGKSTALLQAAYNYEERGQRVVLAKPSIDTKGEREIVSRLGVTREVHMLVKKDESLRDAFKQTAAGEDPNSLLEHVETLRCTTYR